MPNSKQAAKRMRQDQRRRLQNKAIKSSMRTAMRKVLRATSPEAAEKLLPDAMRRIDKAAKANVVHRNAAARYKSRLARTARSGATAR